MRRITALYHIIAAALLAVAPGVSAQQFGDPVAGKEKAALCAGCHGQDGNSASADFPRLAGQYAPYIVKQISDFQRGRRNNNDTMAGMAATVASMDDAKDIAAYFSQRKMAAKALAIPKAALVAAGKKLFAEGNIETGVYACINCHGDKGKGKAPNNPVFPVIGGQHRDYLIKQLGDFREGRRQNDPAGMMSAIAKKLSEQEIEAVASYLSTL
jgi:cytochrome c553